jgi:plastocyanin
MRHRLPLLAFWISCLVRITVAQEAVEKPLYQPTGYEATVTGVINVLGDIPRPRLIDMTADPVCVDANPRPELNELIVKENKLQNAFVYVKSDSLNGYSFPVPDSAVVLQHRNCYYSPHVLGVMTGQKLSLVNSDQTTHNTHTTPKMSPEWNRSSPPNSPPFEKSFRRAEMFVPFKDNQHPWERAYVSVMDHPFFAVTDEFGRFEIRGLPAGTYTLVVWHERLGEQQVEITLGAGESRNADFTFEAGKKP